MTRYLSDFGTVRIGFSSRKPRYKDLDVLLPWMVMHATTETRYANLRLTDEEDRALFEIASKNDVTSLVAHTLQDIFGLEHIEDRWLRSHEATYSRVSSYLTELDGVASFLLNEHGIKLVALKNSGIARGIYHCPGCCPMGDIDVLIEKQHFRPAHQALLSIGYHFEFRNTLEKVDLDLAEKSGGAEYWTILPNGEKLWLELQWRPVAGRWIRSDQEPSAEELIARSISIPQTDVRILSPEDNLLQVALHTAKHSYVRAPGFRLHTDVDRIVRYQAIDWIVFLDRVQRIGAKDAVFFSLDISHTLFGTPIPAEVLSCLKPPAWKIVLISRWIRRAGLLNPHEKKFSRLGYIIFVAFLHDSIRELWQNIFPPFKWMQERYGFQQRRFLPYYHWVRLFDLLIRRTST